MARVHTTGFEYGIQSANDLYTRTAGLTVSSTTKRSGNYSLRINGLVSATQLGATVTQNQANAIAGLTMPMYYRVYVNFATFPSAENTFQSFNLLTNNSPMIYTTIDNSGVVNFYDEDGLIGTSSALSTGVWYRLEYRIDTTSGAGFHFIEMLIDGVAVGSQPNGDWSVTTYLDCFTIGGNLKGEAQTTGDWFFDDYAHNDSTGGLQVDYPGEGKIVSLKPNGAGDSNTWEKSDGSAGDSNNYQAVDEDPVTTSGGDYVRSTTLDQLDLYTIESLPAEFTNGSKITLTYVSPAFQKDISPGNSFSPVIKIGSTEYTDIEYTSLSAYASVAIAPYTASVDTLILYTNPDTSAEWTSTDIDSVQIGMKLTTDSGTRYARIHGIRLEVEFTLPTTKISSILGTGYNSITEFDGQPLSALGFINGVDNLV